jgi:signal transduction histidine kinase
MSPSNEGEADYERLASTVDRIANGDTSVRTGLSGAGGDIGRIAAEIDALAEALEQKDRYQASIAARRDEAFALSTLVIQSPWAFWTADRDLIITFGRIADVDHSQEGEHVNEACKATTGAACAKILEAHRRALEGEQLDFEVASGGRLFRVLLVSISDVDTQVVGVMGAKLDITSWRRTEEANARLLHDVESTHKRLALLSRRLIEVQEQERAVTARELHDDVGQALTSIRLQLSIILSEESVAEMPHSMISNAKATVDDTLQLVRELSLTLRPSLLEHLGLGPTLRWYIAQQATHGHFTGHFEMDPLDFRVSLPVATTCFRITQHAIRHARKFLQSSLVDVHLACTDPTLKLRITCNSSQIEDQKGTTDFELLLIRERARFAGGHSKITSSPTGTEISIQLPIKQ